MANSASRSRRDGRSANGTLTLRRPSTTPVGQASQNTSSTEHAVQQPVAAETIPAQHSNHDSGSRYSKEELLDVFRSHKPSDDPSRLFISGWDPSQVNGGASHGWGKVNETHVPQEPGVCWDHTGQTFPLGLQQMTIEEKEVFIHTLTMQRSCTHCFDRLSRATSIRLSNPRRRIKSFIKAMLMVGKHLYLKVREIHSGSFLPPQQVVLERVDEKLSTQTHSMAGSHPQRQLDGFPGTIRRHGLSARAMT